MTFRQVDWRNRSGAALVEFALAAPVLIGLALGATDFARLLYNGQALAAATRIGAEYARNSSTCQNSSTGIQLGATPGIGTTCNTNIQSAMQNARNFSPTLTFPGGNRLECYCSTGARCSATDWMPSDYSCATNNPGSNQSTQVFIRVTAAQTAPTPLFPWPGFPTTLNAVSELRLQ